MMMTQKIAQRIGDTVTTEVFGVWFPIGAALVFLMQAGFATAETGYTPGISETERFLYTTWKTR